MKTIKFIAISAVLMSASAAFAHGDAEHATPKASVVKEQKPWGIAGDAKAVRRTITLRMTDDMRFTPSQITVKRGETVRLRVENQGQVMHEVVLGTQATLDEHAQMMLKFPTMEHSEPYMAHVSPGKAGDLLWNFNRSGRFDFACLIAGHYQAGMKGTITVE
ncbi:MAG: cupredoxin family protein [Acidovorax sp.]|nr:cupredoxin family protein [Acidovorax sp.]